MNKKKVLFFTIAIIFIILIGLLIFPKTRVGVLEILPINLEAQISEVFFNTSWGYRANVTIQASQVDSTLTNFPIYVNLSDLGSSFFSNSNTDCTDLRVTEADETTETAREVVFCNTTAETGQLHFLADSLSSSVDTVFWIYYGNSDATEPAADATFGSENTWNSGYLGIYHLQESVNTDVNGYSDSTSNDLHGDGVDMNVAEQTGAMGNAQEFEGGTSSPTLDYIQLGVPSDWNSLGTNDNFTISAWAWLQDATQANNRDSNLVGQNGAGNSMLFWYDDDGSGDGYCFYSGAYTSTDCASINNALDETWQYVVLHYDGTDTGSEAAVYVNGTTVGLGRSTQTFTQETSINMRIGAIEAGSGVPRPWYGRIDEVRISDVAIHGTADWVSAEYVNQATPTTFYAVGAEEAGEDTESPQWFDNSTNSTTAGTLIEHRVRWTNTALSGYIFSFDNGTGTLINDSFIEMSGAEDWSNVSKVVNSTVGSTIQWQIYANDSIDQLNATDIFQYTTTSVPTDSCSCPSINTNWEINMTDACKIYTDCDIGTGNISFINTGTAEFNATITAKNMGQPPSSSTLLIGPQCVVNLG